MTPLPKLTTALQLFSQTKFITSLATIQLWEKGLVDYDSEELLAKYIPELVEAPILDGFAEDGQPITHKRTKPLTLRHLLTHTSGLAYNFLSPDLLKYQIWKKTPSFLSKNAPIEALLDPLLFEPGTNYNYGIGIDWAGILVERITGKKLGEYFDENIFGPLGIKNTSFYPTPEILANLQQLCGRDAERKLVHTPGMRDVPNLKPGDIGIHSGGAGILGTAKDYLRLCAGVLASKNEGQGGILTPKGYELVFESALPPREEEGKTHTCYGGLGLIHQILGVPEEQYTSGEKVTHTLACVRVDAPSKFGRNAGSVNWGGIAKTQWWIDPTAGIAGFCGTQLMDQLDQTETVRVWKAYERALYDALAK